MLYLNVFGQPVIVVNSIEDARNLLDKRGHIYSSRPRSVYVREMCVTIIDSHTLIRISLALHISRIGLKNGLTMSPYGERLQTQRRMMQRTFNSQTIKDFRHSQREQVWVLLRSILNDETNYVKAVKRCAISPFEKEIVFMCFL